MDLDRCVGSSGTLDEHPHAAAATACREEGREKGCEDGRAADRDAWKRDPTNLLGTICHTELLTISGALSAAGSGGRWVLLRGNVESVSTK
jgi:hypothetical protein